MPIVLSLVEPQVSEQLIAVLLAADEDEARVRSIVADGMHSSYAALDGGRLIGGVTMRWEKEESEIEYIAVVEPLRGQGYGKQIIAAVLQEAQRRSVKDLLVGTDNTAWETIAFYQKCGFRMDHVRRDFFQYIDPPIIRHGISLLDMLVLRYIFAPF